MCNLTRGSWSGGVICAAWVAVFGLGAARGSNCEVTSVGLTPLNDLGSGLYLGLYPGGLYPNGLNVPPAAHDTVGQARAAAVQPLNPAGQPDPNGHYVLLSIGMSNTTQEFCGRLLPGDPCGWWTFMGQAEPHPNVNHTSLVIVNGAKGGQTAQAWDDPNDVNYDRIRNTWLTPLGLSEAQVQAVWVKVANAQPTASLPDPDADAFLLVQQLGNIARTLKTRYPNVRVVFLASRIYAGYASTALNPEPYAYESAFAAKWVIEAQSNQMAGGGIDPRAGDLNYDTVAPWLAWGPYLWADGLVPRSDGLIWECANLENDGTHPSQSGEQKVGTLLLDFMLNSPYARPWFFVPGSPAYGDLNCDGVVNFDDINPFVLALSNPAAYHQQYPDCNILNADCDADGDVDFDDINPFVALLSGSQPPARGGLEGNGIARAAGVGQKRLRPAFPRDRVRRVSRGG